MDDSNPDETPGCFTTNFSSSDATFLTFFLTFLACFLFSSSANSFLFFLTVRYRQLLWQPQYILINNISACGVGLSLMTGCVVLTAIARTQTQVYGAWCIAQFSALRCFFIASQLTLATMAAERYIFVCHGIHYLRMISTANVRVGVGLVWLVSAAASLHGGFVLSRGEWGFRRPTGGLLCDAFTVKEHARLSWKEDLQLFGPASVIATVCIVSICYCYGRMYHTALTVTTALKCSNHRANRTVGNYLLMFLSQMTSNISFVILTMAGNRKEDACMTISIVTPLLIVLPPCITASFFCIWNPQIRRLLLLVFRCPFMAEVEGLHSRGADWLEGGTRPARHSSPEDRRSRDLTPAEDPAPGDVSVPPRTILSKFDVADHDRDSDHV